MNVKLIKVISVLGLVTGLHAADVSVSGFLDADVAADYNSETGELKWQSNHEIDLTAGIAASEKVKVELYATTTTLKSDGSGAVPYGGGAVGDRWSTFVFDGLALIWDKGFGTITVGDMTYNSKRFGYYYYKRKSPTISETYIRGVGISASGFTGSVGSLDSDELSAGSYLAYSLVAGPATIKPFAAMQFGGASASDIPVKAGVEYSVAAGDHTISGEVGMVKDVDMDPAFTILVEPVLALGGISLAATGYYAYIPDEKASATVIEEEYFVYVEPGMSFSDEFAAGLPLEYHGGVKDADEESIWIVPTAYVYPAKDVQWWIWAGAVIYTGEAVKNNDVALSLGSEIIMNF